MNELPLKLVVMIEATNGTTMLKGVEEICMSLKHYHFPQVGEVTRADTWKVTVLEAIDCLPLAGRVITD